MDVKSQVGETAGKVWNVLNNEGPQTVGQLKKKVNGSPDLLNFAIGWLAREDKVELTPQKKALRVQLK